MLEQSQPELFVNRSTDVEGQDDRIHLNDDYYLILISIKFNKDRCEDQPIDNR